MMAKSWRARVLDLSNSDEIRITITADDIGAGDLRAGTWLHVEEAPLGLPRGPLERVWDLVETLTIKDFVSLRRRMDDTLDSGEK
jgi:hypothetical protein